MLRPQTSISLQFINDLSSSRKWESIFSLYKELRRNSQTQFTNPSFFHPILKSCLYLTPQHGQSLHACVIKDGLESSTSSIGNSVTIFYLKCGEIGLARRVFDCSRIRDSVSWNVMINGYFENGDLEQGLELFTQARIENNDFEPNTATLVLASRACRSLRDTDEGLRLHGYLIRRGHMVVASIQNSILSFYSDIDINSAQKLFDEMLERDLISWSVMIKGYIPSEKPEIALRLFREILSRNEIEIDAQLTVSVIKVSVHLEELDIGKMIHGVVISRGFHEDLFVGNSLIDMYSKCDAVGAAMRVFAEMCERNDVSYNSLLSGFVSNKKFLDALDLYKSMQRAEIKADEVTIVNLLQTSKHFQHSFNCTSIHTMILRLGHEKNKLVINSLIDAYAKCNLITLALKLFSRVEKRDMVTWTTMIAGFTHCGLPSQAINLFQEMIFLNEKPNNVTIINLIEACSVLAEVKRSKSAHAIAIRSHVADEVGVGTAILDMYSKSGDIDTCEKVFEHQILGKNIISWSAMISAYGMNGLPHKALNLAEKMKSQGLKPNPVTILSILSSCSHGGLIKEGLLYFNEYIHDNNEVKLGLEHYSCLVDLLARAGKFNNAIDLLKEMPNLGLEPGPSAWGALLSAYRKINYENDDKINNNINNDFEIGGDVVSNILEMEPLNSGGYILALGMYASSGAWIEAARMRWMVRERGVRVVAGYSLVHVNGGAFKFVAGEKQSLNFSDDVCGLSKQLHLCLKMDKPQDRAFLEGL